MEADKDGFINDSVDVDPETALFKEHVGRYWWVRDRARGADVLDCACGKGYGSFLLATAARQVLGIDINERSLAIARHSFRRDNLSFDFHDALWLETLGRQFDLITAFEIIEHIPEADTRRFLDGLAGALKPGGHVIISTPNHDVVTKSGVVIPDYHINNYTPQRLQRTLSRHFEEVRLHGQFRPRGWLNTLLFSIDIWNLRHVVAAAAGRAPGETVGEDRTGGARSLPADYFEHPPPERDAYRFSPWHWRQAGITVAVCAGPKRPVAAGSAAR